MNARTAPEIEAVLELIPISCIRPSPFKAQTIRRGHFSSVKMLELAASISANGVLQPILVRPVNGGVGIQYEIVAGERRWIAADRAGLAHIPATVRDLTDAQVLEAQLVENLQREGLHVLEEAEGYRELMDMTKCKAEDIGDKIGKSRSYVYARLKLLDLIPAAREALNTGELDASKALVLARIKGEKMQTRALKLIGNMAHGYSYRRLIESLREDCMIPISQAPWLPDRDTLHEAKGGAPVQQCSTCPTRSCNDPELLAEIGDNQDVCVDRACYDLKTKLHFARLRHDYESQGKTIISGEAAKGYPTGKHDVAGKGLVRLDAECDAIEFGEPEPEQGKDESDEDFEKRLCAWNDRLEAFTPPTYGEVLGKTTDITAVEHAGKLIELAPIAAVVKALKAKKLGIPWHIDQEFKASKNGDAPDDDDGNTEADRQRAAAAEAREREREKVEYEFRGRLLAQIHAKYKGPMKQQELALIAGALNDHLGTCNAFDDIYPERPNFDKLKDLDLQRFIVLILLVEECAHYRLHNKASNLLAYAQRLKIDVKKLRTEVVKDLKPVSAPAAEEETTPKAKKKGAKK